MKRTVTIIKPMQLHGGVHNYRSRRLPPGSCEGSDVAVEWGVHQDAPRKIVRCPACNRRLLVAEIRCVGGELNGFRIPAHKPRTHRAKGPRRKVEIRR